MNSYRNFQSTVKQATKKFLPKTRKLIFIFQISFVITLLVVWLSSESLRQSKSLLVFFLYTIPSNFLIAVVPYDPSVLYFGKFHPSLNVAMIGIAGTLVTEILNYSVFKFVTDLNAFKKIRHKKIISKPVDLFNKAPFPALLIAAFLPIPFYPFRFLVVIAHYPLIKYIVAVFIGRAPRLYLIALFGHIIKLPDYILLILFFAFAIGLYLPFLKPFLKKD